MIFAWFDSLRQEVMAMRIVVGWDDKYGDNES
jgi:hypothetical protein